MVTPEAVRPGSPVHDVDPSDPDTMGCTCTCEDCRAGRCHVLGGPVGWIRRRRGQTYLACPACGAIPPLAHDGERHDNRSLTSADRTDALATGHSRPRPQLVITVETDPDDFDSLPHFLLDAVRLMVSTVPSASVFVSEDTSNA